MLCEIMLEIIERTLSVFIRCADNLMLLLVIAKNQPCEIKSTKIRLVAQRREIFAQIIEVKVVLRLLELHDLILLVWNEVIKYVDIALGHYSLNLLRIKLLNYLIPRINVF